MRAFVLFALLSKLAFAAPTAVFIETPSGGAVLGLDPATYHALIRQAVSSLGYPLVPSANDATTTLRPALLKLGTSLIISIERIEGGQIVGASKLKAANVEETDEVTQRVVRALLVNRTTLEDARPSDVSQQEVYAGTRRRASRSGTNLSGGMSFGNGLTTSGVGYYLSLDRAWAIGQLYIGFGFEFALLPNSGGATGLLGGAHFGAQYYFLDSDVSPFVGLDFGPSFARTGTADWYSGVGLGASAGVGFFRTYDIHARAGLRVASILASSAPTVPLTLALFIGVGF